MGNKVSRFYSLLTFCFFLYFCANKCTKNARSIGNATAFFFVTFRDQKVTKRSRSNLLGFASSASADAAEAYCFSTSAEVLRYIVSH